MVGLQQPSETSPDRGLSCNKEKLHPLGGVGDAAALNDLGVVGVMPADMVHPRLSVSLDGRGGEISDLE